jgi:hypothetical protein
LIWSSWDLTRLSAGHLTWWLWWSWWSWGREENRKKKKSDKRARGLSFFFIYLSERDALDLSFVEREKEERNKPKAPIDLNRHFKKQKQTKRSTRRGSCRGRRRGATRE